jgi:uracil-DNA glycosylase
VNAQHDLFAAPADEPPVPAGNNRLERPLSRCFDDVPRTWRGVTDTFRESATGRALIEFVDARVAGGAVVYPARVFHALDLTPPERVRIVILGQDPYHGPGQAQGLAFSVPVGQRVPPSLRNIHKELAADVGVQRHSNGDLSAWAAQGVLLLNTTLTVEDGQPQSHARQGWETLTDALITHVSQVAGPCVFMLWGAPAQRKSALIDAARHLVLTANHPSPLSALRPPQPFLGCGHFSKACDWLAHQRPGEPGIVW